MFGVVYVVNRWSLLQMERRVMKAIPFHNGLTRFLSAFCRLPPVD